MGGKYCQDRRLPMLQLETWELSNFSKISNLDDLNIYLPVFPSRTNLRLYNISVTPRLVKKVIPNLHLSKTSGPDWIPKVVLKNSLHSSGSYILTELFSICLKESRAPDCLKNAGEIFTAKNYYSVNHLSAISKVFEKSLNNRSDFQYGFISSWSTADFLTAVSDRIPKAFNRSFWAIWAVALDLSKVFNRVLNASLLHRL